MIRERLEREFGLDLIATAPNVVYRVIMEDGTEHTVTNPSEFPEGGKIAEVYEPVVRATILAPTEFIARSWSCARPGAAPCSAWTTSPRTGSRSATPSPPSRRSSSTSSTS